MFHQREPVVGTWFVNQTGKLFKVKLLTYSGQTLHKVFVEYLDGANKIINADEWYCLKLNIQLDQASLSMKLH
jgi:hypothetical protein